MSGLSIVQACLALNFYRTLPEALINRVFNIEFIRRLEDEIEMCYSKATYPERVLNQVMQLNRAVCLDCPAAGVPWFQQNYIEAQMSKCKGLYGPFKWTHCFLKPAIHLQCQSSGTISTRTSNPCSSLT